MNNKPQKLVKLLQRLWLHFGMRRKTQLFFLLCLMVFTSIAEIFNIASVMPFVGVIVAPEKIFNNPIIHPIAGTLGISDPNQLLLPVALLFAAIVLITNGLRLIVLWASTRLSSVIGSDLSLHAFRTTLYQPYISHVSRNSSEVSSSLGKVSIIVVIINTIFTLIGSVIILIPILATIIYLDPLIAFIFFGGFGLIYLCIIFLTKKKLLSSGSLISESASKTTKLVQESLGGIRDILIDGTQEVYCKAFGVADREARLAQGVIQIISASPRFFMEAFGLILILVLAVYMMLYGDGVDTVIPVLATLGFAAQRLLPIIQNIYSAWTGIQGARPSLQDALDLLDQDLPDHALSSRTEGSISFDRLIRFEEVSFQYGERGSKVFSELNLSIPKGSKLGLIGKTGCGKSTLLDMLMGLINPDGGLIKIDEQVLSLKNQHLWQKHIAHVPQSIFLADATIAENIAFGVPRSNIDYARVSQAIQMAQLSDVINSWPSKYDTRIGERGVRLSGGQRQRIGIARALYKKAEVIIFDEATSALDGETESAVMEAIDKLDNTLTIIIIAHRLSTLKNCSTIIELGGGGILRSGSYSEMCLS
jgi:ATP-binding cassette subfamily B protein